MEYTKKIVLDVDIVIAKWNEKNPNAKQPMTRKRLADIIDVSDQTLSDWKNGRCPKLIHRLFKLMELGDCSLEDLTIPTDGK